MRDFTDFLILLQFITNQKLSKKSQCDRPPIWSSMKIINAFFLMSNLTIIQQKMVSDVSFHQEQKYLLFLLEKAWICLRCYDRCLIQELQETKHLLLNTNSRAAWPEKVFQESAKWVSLPGNQFVSTIARLLWLRLIPGWFMRHCWYFPCWRLLWLTDTLSYHRPKHKRTYVRSHVGNFPRSRKFRCSLDKRNEIQMT